jgi:RNA polymerase sigma-70 factor (ECF subfamily)
MATEPTVLDTLAGPTSRASVDAASDASLLREMMDGSQDALATLYDRHGQAVFAAAMRTSQDRSIAAEVVQETFLVLWNRAESFDPSRGSLPTWLLAIARNRAVDRLRAASRHDRAAIFSSFGSAESDDASTVEWLTASGQLIAAAGPEPGPESALAGKEIRGSIGAAISSLDPTERVVIELAYDDGLSQSEIADRLGWPIGTVKTRTRRALRHLRERLERSWAGEPQQDPATRRGAGRRALSGRTSGPADGRVENRVAAWRPPVTRASPCPGAVPC